MYFFLVPVGYNYHWQHIGHALIIKLKSRDAGCFKKLPFLLIDAAFLRLSTLSWPSQRYEVSIHVHYMLNRRKKV